MPRQVSRSVRQLLFLSVLPMFFCGVAVAQYGTAPAGSYPMGYGGSTFTGKVQGTGPTSITLTYMHGNKRDLFEGYAAAPCSLPVSKTNIHLMPFTEVPAGSVLTAFYESKTVTIDGKKQKKREVIAISFLEVNGKTVAPENRMILFCTPSPVLTFKAFENIR